MFTLYTSSNCVINFQLIVTLILTKIKRTFYCALRNPIAKHRGVYDEWPLRVQGKYTSFG